MSLKEELAKKIDKKKLGSIKTAYDMIGNIAVIEIDRQEKEIAQIIAKTIFEINSIIKSVYRKDGGHDGNFRIQNYTYVAGEKNTITMHKENGVALEMDINKVYFSPRSATERKRVFENIKDDEEVLVLFSGCGPFSIGASKNSNASHITSAEMNPDGHKYAKKNAIANKAFNTTFINIDAKEINNKYYSNFIGLKSGIKKEQIEKRLAKNPKILELYLLYEDLYKNKIELFKTIEFLQKKNIEVVMHMPYNPNSKGISYCLAKKDASEELKVITTFLEVCKKYDIKGVVHPASKEISDKSLIPILERNIRKLKPYYKWLYFENLINSYFSTYEDIVKIAKKTNIKNLCIDTAHFSGTGYLEDEIIDIIKKLTKKFNCHFHVSNIIKGVDGAPLETGELNIKRILPFITSGIVEVTNKNEDECFEMINSYEWIENKSVKFDRIIMPLPKTSFDFLEHIAPLTKKGTIINFYCFIGESEIPQEENRVKKRLKEFGKEIKIIKSTKCGQQSPRCYRVCIDFEVI